jgi:hypothetical protein
MERSARSSAYKIQSWRTLSLTSPRYWLSSIIFSRWHCQRKIKVAISAEIDIAEGETTLVPVSLVNGCHFETDLFFSTFALSEMPRRLQMQLKIRNFGMQRLCFLPVNLGRRLRSSLGSSTVKSSVL